LGTIKRDEEKHPESEYDEDEIDHEHEESDEYYMGQ